MRTLPTTRTVPRVEDVVQLELLILLMGMQKGTAVLEHSMLVLPTQLDNPPPRYLPKRREDIYAHAKDATRMLTAALFKAGKNC